MAFRFLNFPVYKDAKRFRKEVKQITKKFPPEERYVLTDQILRAATSIVLNIAEGTDRGTDIDFARYLNNSLTSLNEVVSCLDVAVDEKYLSDEEYKNYLEIAEKLANQLTAFRKSLLDNPTK